MISSLTPNRLKDPRCRAGTCTAVVALPEAEQAEQARRTLRRLGWSVCVAATAADVRRHLAAAPEGVVILGTQLADESGWLTCAKLNVRPPRSRVLMVGPITSRNRLMARLAGAAALLADPAEIAEWLV